MSISDCKAVSYLAYVAVTPAIGLTRTVLSTVMLIKTFIFHSKYPGDKNIKNNDLQAFAPKFKIKQTSSILGSIKNVVKKGLNDLSTTVTTAITSQGKQTTWSATVQATLDTWKSNLYRGLAEMIPVIGACYCINKYEWPKGRTAEFLGLPDMSGAFKADAFLNKTIPPLFG